MREMIITFLAIQRLQCRDIDENDTIDQSPGSNETTGCPDKPPV